MKNQFTGQKVRIYYGQARNLLEKKKVFRIITSSAAVHDQLINDQGSPDNFRRDLSDHIPVTIKVAVTNDND
jgi:hypothetical protein